MLTDVTVYDGGEMATIQFRSSTGRKVARGKRGKIKSFSRAARRNLLRTIGKLRSSEQVYFVTLTYPGAFPDAKQAKRDLDSLGKRFVRRFGGCSFIWRLEWQNRGAPHFHLLVFGLPLPSKAARRYVSRLWFEVVGSADPKHLLAGTQVARMRSWRGVMAYAGKYVSKVGAIGEPEPGRLWGVVNRWRLPFATVRVIRVASDVAYRIGTYLAQATGYRPLFIGLRYWHVPGGVLEYVRVWAVSAGELE